VALTQTPAMRQPRSTMRPNKGSASSVSVRSSPNFEGLRSITLLKQCHIHIHTLCIMALTGADARIL